jgi:hypothetical protein
MNAKELAGKFSAKILAAEVEKDKQKVIAQEKHGVRNDDINLCQIAMSNNVIPLLEEMKNHLPEGQFSFSTQIDLHNHKVVGVSFRIGDGPATHISTAFGNVVVTHAGASGALKGVNFVYSPDAEPYISNSGDLTRAKIAKLVELVLDNAY